MMKSINSLVSSFLFLFVPLFKTQWTLEIGHLPSKFHIHILVSSEFWFLVIDIHNYFVFLCWFQWDLFDLITHSTGVFFLAFASAGWRLRQNLWNWCMFTKQKSWIYFTIFDKFLQLKAENGRNMNLLQNHMCIHCTLKCHKFRIKNHRIF